MREDEDTYDLMEADKNSLILCGHTHYQKIIEHNGKRVINPGAVGALNSQGKSQFAILKGMEGVWDCKWPKVPEKYWEQAVEELIRNLSKND